MKTTLRVLLSAALFTYLSGCGAVEQFKAAAGDAQNESDAADAQAAALTEEAATEAADEAETAASVEDANTDVEGPAGMPAFLEAVEAARDYTRQLLGIDDGAIKEFRAALQAAKALSSTPDDFEANIASAKLKFEAALEAQRALADAARLANAASLQAIFDGTTQVFLSCGMNEELGGDVPPPPRREKGEHKGGKKHKKGGKGDGQGAGQGAGQGPGQHFKGGPDDLEGMELQGDESDAGEEGDEAPRMMIGKGHMKGGMKKLRQHGGQKQSFDDSAECQAATSALLALIPAASAPVAPAEPAPIEPAVEETVVAETPAD